MDREDDDDQNENESEEKLPIKKTNIDKYFGKADKSVKFLSVQYKLNLIKQVHKV